MINFNQHLFTPLFQSPLLIATAFWAWQKYFWPWSKTTGNQPWLAGKYHIPKGLMWLLREVRSGLVFWDWDGKRKPITHSFFVGLTNVGWQFLRSAAADSSSRFQGCVSRDHIWTRTVMGGEGRCLAAWWLPRFLPLCMCTWRRQDSSPSSFLLSFRLRNWFLELTL